MDQNPASRRHLGTEFNCYILFNWDIVNMWENVQVLDNQSDDFWQWWPPFNHSPNREHFHCCRKFLHVPFSTPSPPPTTTFWLQSPGINLVYWILCKWNHSFVWLLSIQCFWDSSLLLQVSIVCSALSLHLSLAISFRALPMYGFL